MNTVNTPRFNKRKLNKKESIIMIITVLFVIVTLILIAVSFSVSLKGFKRKDEAHEYDKYFVMITDNYKSDFWKAVYRGAAATASEKNIYVDLLGENFSIDYSAEELLKIATASKIDGIIVSADESVTMTKLINAAVNAGIPVVTLGGDNTKSDRLSYVSVGNYNIGREYAKQIINIIQERQAAKEAAKEAENAENKDTAAKEPAGKDTMQVTVLVNSDSDERDSGQSTQNIIFSAIQDSIAQEDITGTELSISIKTVDNRNAFSAEESIRDIFHTQDIPDVIVCLNELNTICAYQAVVDYNKVGDVNILGYYDSESILNAIDRGVVYATIAVNSEQLGEYCITALSDYFENGNTSQYYTADISLITKDNVAEYIKKEGEQDE